MPHAARIWPESDIHLVTAAGNAHCRVFLDSADRNLFLDLLNDVVARFGWELFAWCLLGNHLHWSFEPNLMGSVVACSASRACTRCGSTADTTRAGTCSSVRTTRARSLPRSSSTAPAATRSGMR